MRNVLMATAAAALLAACQLAPDAPAPAPEAKLAAPAAEPPVKPQIAWGNTGRQNPWFYHHVWGDCAFLEHGHGRNNAWGLWRMPLGEVRPGEPAGSEETGYRLEFTCTDGSACIQTGELDETPGRASSHQVPFESRAGLDAYLADIASLAKACRALK